MNNGRVYLKGYVVGHTADTLGCKGLQIQLENLDIVEIDKNLVHKGINEPQKVTVPQFVADWLKENDLREETLGKQSVFDVFDSLKNDPKNGYYENVKRWIDENGDLFARAWLDGYEVEKENRYLVKIKGVVCPYLNHDTINELWFYNQKIEGAYTKTQHTRKELEDADFGWVFDCPGIEIEEVEG